MQITKQDFGKEAVLFSLENDNGYQLDVTNLGARIVNLWVPVKDKTKNIVLGFDSAEEYLEKDAYVGATIGRVAGRISKGQFEIDQNKYQTVTQKEQGGNTLHGGPKSFEEVLWEYETKISKACVQVIFTHTSPDGANGFPGNLTVRVTYTLTNQNEWQLDYQAQTDQSTLFNPTNHVYFNLTGDVEQAVDQHLLEVAADRFAVVKEDTTVTGELRKVSNTPFDFQKEKHLEEVFVTDYSQNVLVDGLDHPFVFSEKADTPHARLIAPAKDIVVEMTTTAPSVVIFTANFGNEGPMMRNKKLVNHGGVTLETQVLPGAIEFTDFGNIVLKPKDTFTSTTKFKIIVN